MKYVSTLALAALLVLAGCSFLNNGGGFSPTPDNNTDNTDVNDNTDDQVEPGPDGKYTEQEHWDALANLVELGRIRHTDEILWVANNLLALGHIRDMSRVEKYREKRITLDESNRAFEANHLRGGN